MGYRAEAARRAIRVDLNKFRDEMAAEQPSWGRSLGQQLDLVVRRFLRFEAFVLGWRGVDLVHYAIFADVDSHFGVLRCAL